MLYGVVQYCAFLCVLLLFRYAVRTYIVRRMLLAVLNGSKFLTAVVTPPRIIVMFPAVRVNFVHTGTTGWMSLAAVA